MKRLAWLTLIGAWLVTALPARAGEVKVSFSDGLVTILATDASPREILGEWARLGQVRVTNLDRLAGAPLTLQLTSVSETQALETILRGTAGYVAAPRREAVTTISRYDRILLMPGLAPAWPVSGATPRPSINTGAGRGGFGQPAFGRSAYGDAGSGGPVQGFAPAWMGRETGQPGANGPAMMRQGMQTFVAAEPQDVQERPAGGLSSSVPGLPAGQPGQTTTGAARPGELTAPPAQPPGMNPAANPYGLPTPGAKPIVQTPAGPIKVPE